MPLYMAQFAYTVDAWAAFTKNPENRTAALQNLAKKVGAKVEGLYYSFGDYDGFVIIDAPDEATLTAMLLAAIHRTRAPPSHKDDGPDAARDDGRGDEEGRRAILPRSG